MPEIFWALELRARKIFDEKRKKIEKKKNREEKKIEKKISLIVTNRLFVLDSIDSFVLVITVHLYSMVSTMFLATAHTASGAL